ncbi:transcriptional regulator [Mycobacteroides chelonae]|uniref:LacI family DNA-binding transcriptional regulator n=1 Tax=Mycobacteroides chelonae TaxID=1774 RepID=UPI0008A896ED|nr:LacI family DNA-binding transcriptional regulator [Mycobacteroides chelonae]OHT78297.1 transcriptional regulator [Mycobacteroides chelonae]
MADVPTLRDVAAAANVSVSTASYALNGKGRVDPSTRAKVQLAAENLGYRANRAGRDLRSGRTSALGLILPPVHDASSAEFLNFDWYGRIAVSATQAAFAADYSLLLMRPSLDDPGSLRRASVDGALIVDPLTADPRIDALRRSGIPSVAIGPGLEQSTHSVCPDLVSTTEELLNQLVDNGATEILVLAPGIDLELGRITTDTYSKWCRTRGRIERIHHLPNKDEPSEITTVAGLIDAAYAVVYNALNSANPPDAILSLVLSGAHAAASAARDLGLSIPEDILIAQDCDEPALATFDPPITAYEFFPGEQARTAVDMLLALIGGQDPDLHHCTRSELRVRASTQRRNVGNPDA